MADTERIEQNHTVSGTNIPSYRLGLHNGIFVGGVVALLGGLVLGLIGERYFVQSKKPDFIREGHQDRRVVKSYEYDINQDGNNDLVLLTSDGFNQYLLSNGDGTYADLTQTYERKIVDAKLNSESSLRNQQQTLRDELSALEQRASDFRNDESVGYFITIPHARKEEK